MPETRPDARVPHFSHSQVGRRMTDPEVGTAVSAPGKVLVAGGYLILDRAYTGLVLGLSARINVVVQEIKTSEGVQLNEMVVNSPQFLEAQWRYGYHLADNDGGIKVTQLQVGGQPVVHNPFVETTLNYALSYVACASGQQPSHSIKAARLTILADNDYYSHAPAEENIRTRRETGRFARFGARLSDTRKTGLGSSAALVTALTAALLMHYLGPCNAGGTFDPCINPSDRSVLHNLAQAAHCAAQGKIGSGFDVAAAVYGSCLYRRFSPSILSPLESGPGSPGFSSLLRETTGPQNNKWDTSVAQPGGGVPLVGPGLAVRLCDVDHGSSTVGMVKSVLTWRAACSDASMALMDDMHGRNEALARALRDFSTTTTTTRLRDAIKDVRELMRAMGVASGAAIEPDSQTALLDALAEGVEGVYGGVVPGAGGYDALALVLRDDAETVARLETFLANWRARTGTKVKLLGVRTETEGLRTEALTVYDGWLSS